MDRSDSSAVRLADKEVAPEAPRPFELPAVCVCACACVCVCWEASSRVSNEDGMMLLTLLVPCPASGCQPLIMVSSASLSVSYPSVSSESPPPPHAPRPPLSVPPPHLASSEVHPPLAARYPNLPAPAPRACVLGSVWACACMRVRERGRVRAWHVCAARIHATVCQYMRVGMCVRACVRAWCLGV